MTEKTKNAMINFFNAYPVGAKISEHIDKVAKNFRISVTTLRKYADIKYMEDYEYIEITKKEYDEMEDFWENCAYEHDYGFDEEMGYFKKNGKYYRTEIEKYYKVNGKKF